MIYTVSVPHIVLVDVLDNLRTPFLADWHSLDPALNVLLRCEVKHGKHLWPVTDV